MKVITASKFYYHRAGLESYLFKFIDLLKEKGHMILPFSTKHPQNYANPYDKYFVNYHELSEKNKLNFFGSINAINNIFYNNQAKKNIKKLIDNERPDIMMGFGVHRHLSPSIFEQAQKMSVPVVHRLSDYALICPCATLLKGDGTICKDFCTQTKFACTIKNKCISSDRNYKLPFAVDFVGAIENHIHTKLSLYTKNVDCFISPSNFLKNAFIKAGFNAKKIIKVPIFIDYEKYEPYYKSEDYFVFVGRLTREKGVLELFEVMKDLKRYKLYVIGDGPLREDLQKIKFENNLENITMLGKLSGKYLSDVIKKARFSIVPSQWYDNSPNVILESYALGVPVIASDIGGIPEYVSANTTGLLFRNDDKETMARKIEFLMKYPAIAEEMGQNSRQEVEKKYNKENHYSRMIETFKNLL